MDKNVKQKLQLSKNCNKTLLQIVTENHYKNGIQQTTVITKTARY